jgi:formylglycine-generating enzyme
MGRSCSTLLLCLCAMLAGCRNDRRVPPVDAAPEASAEPVVSAAPAASSSAPAVRCPPDMVKVASRVCVDRWEVALIDDAQRQASPNYPILASGYAGWIEARRSEAQKLEGEAPGEAKSNETPFPQLPEWQRKGGLSLRAVSRKGAQPNAYLSMYSLRDACVRAGKRLCTLEEWQTACKGEKGTTQPYGEDFKHGKCNVFREEHPGHVLFGQFTVGMLDPRMNLVTSKGKPLLRKTGESPACVSVWGDDAIYDMVGNLDEWIDDPDGTFVGGFYARNTKKGCDQVLGGHPAGYMDYSLGGRCCSDPGP